jgi:hypothetical protein
MAYTLKEDDDDDDDEYRWSYILSLNIKKLQFRQSKDLQTCSTSNKQINLSE